MQAAAVQ